MSFLQKLIPRFYYSFRVMDILLSIYAFPEKNQKNSLYQWSDLHFLNSARAGIYLLLKLLSNGKPMKIGVQPFNCNTVFKAIKEAGCIPVFLEINGNFTIDTNDLRKKKDLIDVLLVTHTFGIPADMDSILSIMAGKYVIEDCAHAYLSGYKNKPCGSHGDAAVFSFNYGKFPSIGHGGFVMINNPGIKTRFIEQYHKLPKPGKLSEIFQPFRNYLYSLAHKPLIYGGLIYPLFKIPDSKYDFLNKYAFSVKKGYRVNRNAFCNNLNRYEKINTIRATRSLQLLSKIFPKPPIPEEGNNFYLIPILRKKRDLLYSNLLNKGYECGKHFSRSIEWAEEYGYQRGTCPVAEKIAAEILVMPNVAWLKKRDMDKIAEILNRTLSYD